MQQAQAYAEAASPAEQALITALPLRFPTDAVNPDFKACNHAYADGMAKAYQRFPDDLDVAALYADALMNLTPWALWDLRTGLPTPSSRAPEAQAVLSRALSSTSPSSSSPVSAAFTHPGLLHLSIHLLEMSPHPERGLPAADALRDLTPAAGHLRHMPAHLDILVGDYRAAIAASRAACAADEAYYAREGGDNFYTVYRLHDYHTLAYAAMFAGQAGVALAAVARMDAHIPEEALRVESPPMADWLEAGLSARLHVLVRFGRWEEIRAERMPEDAALYCVTTAMLHYAKGVAAAAVGEVGEAERERRLLREAVGRVPLSRMEYPNRCVDVLAVAEAMLDGELEYRKGRFEEGFAHLRRAVELDDGLVYSEPRAWMMPSRHAYAALLLEQGRVEDAAEAYAEDLGYVTTLPRASQHPNNVWALHGYHECLTRLGRVTEARIVEQQLKVALAVADVPITASCYCSATATASTAKSEAAGCCSSGDV